jgi:hypothetical protein
MILFAVISTACGTILGRTFRASVLVPSSFSVWLLVLAFAWVSGLSPLQSIAAAILFAACLQLGYLLGATLGDFKKAQRSSRGIIATP